MKQSKAEITKRPPNRIFQSITALPGEYQADIIFMQYAISKDMKAVNDGNTCFLLMIEPATCYAYARPMKTKSNAEVVDAFKDIYKAIITDEPIGIPCYSIRTDMGSEFLGHEFQQALADVPDAFSQSGPLLHMKKEPGDIWSLGNLDSCTQTIKRWLQDWMIDNDSIAWIEALPEVMRMWNNHKVQIRKPDGKSMTIWTPTDMRQSEAALAAVAEADIERGHAGDVRFEKYAVGDHVRIRMRPWDNPRDISSLSKPTQSTAKGSDRWSNIVYSISGIDNYGFMLEPIDKANATPARHYKEHELLKVPDTSIDVPDILAKSAAHACRERRMIKEHL